MKNVMTLGIFAHANAGKTTLTEQFLVHTNVKKNVGRVDYGTTTTDNLEIEQKRGISVKSALVSFDIGDRRVQLIDTPGHIDFSSEVERAISVLDGAILVVSGVEGIEPQTRVIWSILRERNVPTLLFVNKMDRLGADYNKTIKELQSKLDDKIVPKVVVISENNSLKYIDNAAMNFVDIIAELDDDIMNKYLDDETIDTTELEDKVQKLSKAGKIFMTYGGSALNDEGVRMLIDAINEYLPTYDKKRGEFSGYIYKADSSSGQRELYIKVLSGRLNAREKIKIDGDNYEQISNMYKIDIDKKIKANYIDEGEIGIITGLSLETGTIIGNKNIDFTPSKFVNPLFETTISAINSEDSYKLVSSLSTLTDEDPDLDACLNKFTGEVTIKLMGNLQGEVIKSIIETRFGIPVILTKPVILKKETPTEIGYGHCGYTRVSAVGLEVRPLSRGSGIKFKSELSTDILFLKYQKQIARLIKYYSQQGLYGWEITDAEIALVDGKCDNVGSESEHFNIATPLALARALKESNMKLLEPTIEYELFVPEEYLKSVISYLYENGISYSEIKNVTDNYIITGNAYLKDFVDLPVSLSKISSGTVSVIEKPSKFLDSNDEKIETRDYYEINPFNEEEFVMNMKGSFDKLDMAQLKHKKPRKKPNQIRH